MTSMAADGYYHYASLPLDSVDLDLDFDSFPFDGGSFGQSLPPEGPVHEIGEDFEQFEADMTRVQQYNGGEQTAHWNRASSPNETVSSQSDEVAKSPGKHTRSHGSLQATTGGSCDSLSPTSVVLTPGSSNTADYRSVAGYGDPDSDQISTSPGSGMVNSPADDYVYVERIDSELSDGSNSRRMNNLPPTTQSGARLSSSGQTSLPSRESSVSHQSSLQATRAMHWGHSPSFASSTSHNAAMNDPYIPYTTSDDLVFSTQGAFADTQPTTSAGDFDTSSLDDSTYGLPIRSHDRLSQQALASFGTMSTLPQQSNTVRQQTYDAPGFENAGFDQLFNTSSAYRSTPMYQRTMNATDFLYPMPPQVGQDAAYVQHTMPAGVQRSIAQSATNTNMRPARPTPSTTAGHTRSYPQALTISTGASTSFLDERPSSRTARPALPTQSSRAIGPATAGSSTTRPIAQADPSRAGAARTHSSHSGVRKGGRARKSHLNESSRAKSNSMRKLGACWRCALQRDPCDEGTPCTRCDMRVQKGQQYFFDCDRSKLPDFVHDFLPPQASMTLMHQKQSIEDTVSEQVLHWDSDNGIDVYLSSGYGPPLVWRLYEFSPKTAELLSQLQFYQDPVTFQSKSRVKYSPPFGLLKIDTSDDAHFDEYLDTLLQAEHLWKFGWNCYEEENQVDEQMFQGKLLDLMCKLYINTKVNSLKALLRDILRMIIITFIMGHTLTIVEQTLPTVLGSMRLSKRPVNLAKHTSPRLANRQLKFFFAVLRNNIYEKILKWQQQTLHTAGKKDQTWLPAFCVMLGFAMVLEEVQRTIQIQADAAVQKEEMSPEAANMQAFNACERIDSRFKLLIGLFQCKYRDKRWGDRGSFGRSTPELDEPVQREFLQRLRALVEERYDHLKFRESVTYSKDTQCFYTTRLTARFLLPFLNLP